MRTPLHIALGDVIRLLREQRGLTQDQLADRIIESEDPARDARMNCLVASNVRELRERKGLTQADFARALREHPDLRSESYACLVSEIQRAERGHGIDTAILLYIGLRFAESYELGTFGNFQSSLSFASHIFNNQHSLEKAHS